METDTGASTVLGCLLREQMERVRLASDEPLVELDQRVKRTWRSPVTGSRLVIRSPVRPLERLGPDDVYQVRTFRVRLGADLELNGTLKSSGE